MIAVHTGALTPLFCCEGASRRARLCKQPQPHMWPFGQTFFAAIFLHHGVVPQETMAKKDCCVKLAQKKRESLSFSLSIIFRPVFLVMESVLTNSYNKFWPEIYSTVRSFYNVHAQVNFVIQFVTNFNDRKTFFPSWFKYRLLGSITTKGLWFGHGSKFFATITISTKSTRPLWKSGFLKEHAKNTQMFSWPHIHMLLNFLCVCLSISYFWKLKKAQKMNKIS